MTLRKTYVTGMAVVLLAMCSLSTGQVSSVETVPAAPAKVSPVEVLQRIPAGCAGFVIVNNVEGMGAKVDAFIKSISPEGEPMLPMGVVDMLLGQVEFGEGLNRNGPFAAVMLDPQLYGLDLLKMIGLPTKSATAPAAGSATEPATEQPAVPVVLLVPGKDPAKLLAAHNPVKDGDYFRTDGGTFWIQLGNFVVGSPNKKALAAVVKAEKSVVSELSLADKALIVRNDAAAWVNFKVVGPMAEGVLAGVKGMLTAEEDPAMAGVIPMFDMYGALIREVQDVALGVRFVPSGILIETQCSFKPEGIVGKALATVKLSSGPLLNRLPTMPYIMAFGARGTSAMPKELNAKMLDSFVTSGLLKDLSAESIAKLKQMAGEFDGQVDGVQLYLGGVTSGEGQIGVAYVLECKSAAKVRELLPDYIALVSEIYQAMDDENINQIALKYHKGLETIDDRKVDVISIDHPKLASMEVSDQTKLRAVLGEDKIRLLVAQADAKTLVLTLGGGKSFLAAALGAAGGTGKLAADPATAKSLKMLPTRRMAVGLLNVGNVIKVIKSVSMALGEEPPPINIQAPEPIAGSISVEKSDVQIVCYIPSDTVKNVMAGFMMMMMGPMGPQGGGMAPMPMPMPAPGPGGF